MALINTRTNLSDQHIGGGATPSTGVDWGGIINSGIGALSDVYDNYINAQMQAAGMANAASAAAQNQQFAMNLEMMSQQIAANTSLMREAMNYNAKSAQEANALQYQMQQEAMAFNSEEAQKNRSWQEQMSNTAYQRAVQDMRKAGINPILAATNGGATVGSGASASISSAKAAQASGMNGTSVGLPSVGTYTGQGYHLSDTFATFGAILGTVGNLLSAFQANGGGQLLQNYVREGVNSITNGVKTGIDNALSDLNAYYNKFTDNPLGRWYKRNNTDVQNWYTKRYPKEGSTGGGGGHYF